MITELVLGLIGISLLKARKRKQQQIEGIGRIKRRVYVEVATAQDAGIDFAKKYIDLTEQEKNTLTELGERFQYKQTKRSLETGKAYAESYYNSLRRAWNAVSGVIGVGAPNYKDYKVRNREGNIALIYRQYADAIEHVQQEKSLEEIEESLRKKRNRLRRKGFTSADFALPEPPANPLPNPQETTEDEYQQMMDEVYNNVELTAQEKILAAAPHMTVATPDGIKTGNERPADFNWVVVVDIKYPQAELSTYMPIRAFYDKWAADKFVDDLRKAWNYAKKQHTMYVYTNPERAETRRYTVVPVSKVRTEKISGLW